MEQSSVSSVELKSGETSSAVAIEYFDDSSTQDATDFEHHFDSDSNQSIIDDDSRHLIDDTSEKITKKNVDSEKVLTLNVTNYFKDFNQTNILSPISELAMNVASTNLTATSDLTGKFHARFESVSCLVLLFSGSIIETELDSRTNVC